jgi:hypothetical protein
MEFELYNKKLELEIGKSKSSTTTWDYGLQLELQTWKPYTLNLANIKIQVSL